jgi:hypothetical protein
MAGVLDVIAIGESLINRFIPDPVQKAQAKADLRSADLAEEELKLSAIIMEAKSQDKWTSRARPSLMYVIYLYLLMGVPVAILSIYRPESAAIFTQSLTSFFRSMPTELWTTFTIGYLGYTGARSYDKGKKKLRD